MNILIGQPKHEKGLTQLKNVLSKTSDVNIVLFPEGYLFSKDLINDLKKISREYNVMIITSYKDDNKKDRIIIIDKNGEVLLERAKTPVNSNILHENILLQPSRIETEHGNIGIVLCMEIFFDLDELNDIDFIFNPIGVGMFSDEQFKEWTNRAKYMAKNKNAIIIGASHGDGFYRDYKVSIPISYLIDNNGQAHLMTKNDTKYRVINTKTYQSKVIEGNF